MPYESVEDALAKHPNLKKYTAKGRKAWVSAFNSQYEAGKSEGTCFASAYSAASRVGKKAAVSLDIEVGDTLLGGKFKNSPLTVEEFGTDDLGQPTVNGKKLLAFRIKKNMPTVQAQPGKSASEKDLHMNNSLTFAARLGAAVRKTAGVFSEAAGTIPLSPLEMVAGPVGTLAGRIAPLRSDTDQLLATDDLAENLAIPGYAAFNLGRRMKKTDEDTVSSSLHSSIAPLLHMAAGAAAGNYLSDGSTKGRAAGIVGGGLIGLTPHILGMLAGSLTKQKTDKELRDEDALSNYIPGVSGYRTAKRLQRSFSDYDDKLKDARDEAELRGKMLKSEMEALNAQGGLTPKAMRQLIDASQMAKQVQMQQTGG